MDYDAHGSLLFLLPIRDLCLRRAHAEGGLDPDAGIHGKRGEGGSEAGGHVIFEEAVGHIPAEGADAAAFYGEGMHMKVVVGDVQLARKVVYEVRLIDDGSIAEGIPFPDEAHEEEAGIGEDGIGTIRFERGRCQEIHIDMVDAPPAPAVLFDVCEGFLSCDAEVREPHWIAALLQGELALLHERHEDLIEGFFGEGLNAPAELSFLQSDVLAVGAHLLFVHGRRPLGGDDTHERTVEDGAHGLVQLFPFGESEFDFCLSQHSGSSFIPANPIRYVYPSFLYTRFNV